MSKPTLNTHAKQRLKERFGVDSQWLVQAIENRRAVRLNGHGHDGSGRKVRSGHLIYLPDKEDYCVVVMDDRNRVAITVLTEEMALVSSWGNDVTIAAKLRAKKRAFDDMPVELFLREYAQILGGISAMVRLRSYTVDWTPKTLSLLRIKISSEQFDVRTNTCALSEDQTAKIYQLIQTKLKQKAILSYGELYAVHSTGQKTISIAESDWGLGGLEEAASAKRWATNNQG